MNYTVIEIMLELGVEPEKKVSWMLGNAVREKWKEKTGSSPEYALRPKTSGNGSHCFAVYPGWFRRDMKRIVKRHKDLNQ